MRAALAQTHKAPVWSGCCVIARHCAGGVLLRAIASSRLRGIPDTDKALREVWIAAAWAELNPLERNELAKQIRRGEKLYEL